MGRGVSDAGMITAVSVGMTAVSVEGSASAVGEEQETIERMQKAESRLVLTTERRVEGMRVAACLCMGGF